MSDLEVLTQVNAPFSCQKVDRTDFSTRTKSASEFDGGVSSPHATVPVDLFGRCARFGIVAFEPGQVAEKADDQYHGASEEHGGEIDGVGNEAADDGA